MFVTMRPGVLVRLLAAVAVVSALSVGLVVTGRPATASSPGPAPVVSSLTARAAADVRPCTGT